ncbi:DUF5644 domain-containing protein [Halarcobacter ebronensis]|uniref:DUF5644 domain-containing protein n=1 Tax=Halarcobacter ebronensis TaxID=1462615 RepID=A0A4Q1AHA8_9BACT|nr:DUF5644 domain-containing protein [Halarcobacter ebronensis]QKF82653.1 hypothetical protein AEBR_2179 [Halarcobacter ebronensis]RXK02076.1 hypothetical protein CRV07_14275 [Halarcobacter ebronensis]
MKLEISLFRFDYKSDYLPYYTKNFIKIKNEKTLQEILNTINDEAPFEYRNTDHFLLVVNGYYTTTATTISDLVEDFGTDLTIEPISIRRAHTDLCINDADFQERLKVLAEFIDEEDIKKYNEYKIYFYASNTINYEYDYIGDAILLLAYDLIQKDNSKEKDILEALKEYECGAQFHTNLKNRVFNFDNEVENKIETIREKLKLIKPIKEQNLFLDKKNSIDFGTFEDDYKIKHNFEDFNLAYFSGLEKDVQTLQLLESLNAKIIDTPSMHTDLALQTFHVNSDFSIKLASTVMLDAFDNSADLLVVDCENLFYLFDSNRKAMQKVSGREIILPVIHKNELQKLVSGEHEAVKPQLKKHVIDPEII